MKSKTQNIDGFIITLVFFLLAVGSLVVFSSTSRFSELKHSSPMYLFGWHVFKVFAGVLIMILFINIDYRIFARYSRYIALSAFILLVLVLLLTEGSVKRRFYIGALSFQPSEFARFALIVYIAKLLEEKQSYIKNYQFGFLPVFVIITVFAVLIALEPSVSMAFVVFATGVLMMFVAGVKFSHLVLTLIPVSLVSLFYVFRSYRLLRILAFLGFPGVPGEVKFQALQALIGLGNGGIFGVGPGHSKQSYLFLPHAYDDYIFAIIGEEYGFIGAMVVLIAFVILAYRGFKISLMCTDNFGRFLSAGVTISIFITAIFHIGVVVGILPPTGIPLPFVSYGGSAMMVNCLATGVLLNISKQTGR